MMDLDRLFERTTRGIARRASRRGILSLTGKMIAGGLALPLLPVERATAAPARAGATPDTTPNDPGDAQSCEYWRYCAIDGYLCSCCGGTVSSCPPGTEMSPITWIGTCMNPGDGRAYIISYNDCCGRSSCGRCRCNRNEGERPMVRPQANNDINWCLGTQSAAYHCSTAIILGTAPGGKA
ncbi:methylamine dehydrogenase light chain [Novosphingobium aquae]|uniref:Methylamine dehydrogenase (amicyanin) n=1 Tax=Novosphingobium aquae TaxID=3133435 RepID=A0ABU8S676_9SPHN